MRGPFGAIEPSLNRKVLGSIIHCWQVSPLLRNLLLCRSFKIRATKGSAEVSLRVRERGCRVFEGWLPSQPKERGSPKGKRGHSTPCG